MTPALEVIGIAKAFGPVVANRDVSLTVAAGSIHGLVGENGAGKSTLMNIVYGTLKPDRGSLRVQGRPLVCRSPRDAIAAGIGMVHQHFMLIDSFTVVENLLLGREGGWRLGGGEARVRADLARLTAATGLEVPADHPISELPVGLRQRVEIIKALIRGARLLILDEPTGVLTPPETDHLFQVLRTLRDQGTTIILISHKLGEIMALTDRVTVMRQGAVVAEVATAATSAGDLAERMVGHPVTPSAPRPAPARQPMPDPVLTVDGLAVRDDRGVQRVKGLRFSIAAGEIVGLAGVSGNGQTELLEALAGMRPVEAGAIRIAGQTVAAPDQPTDPATLRAAGVAHVPEDRQGMGLIAGFSLWENALLGHQRSPALTGRLWLHRAAALAHCRALIAGFDIRPDQPDLPVTALSGGNQQKLVMAREIAHHPRVLLIGQPTRGVDIGAVALIHRRLIALRDQGAAILVVSADLEELLALSDRLLVICQGRITGEAPAGSIDPRRFGLLMTGGAPAG